MIDQVKKNEIQHQYMNTKFWSQSQVMALAKQALISQCCKNSLEMHISVNNLVQYFTDTQDMKTTCVNKGAKKMLLATKGVS